VSENVEVDEILGLSVAHAFGESVEEDGELVAFRIRDGEEAVDLRHEFGDPDEAAAALFRIADRMRAHAAAVLEQGYGRRMRTAGAT
jgi:hypothetical protein